MSVNVTFDRLRLHGFGPYFNELDVVFGGGLSVVCSPNEWGKSSAVAGLAAVLYGLPGSADPREHGQARYRNWNGSARFGGELDLTLHQDGPEQIRYRIVRDFTSHHVRLVRLEAQGPLTEIDSAHNPNARRKNERYEDRLRELLGIHSHELFLATFCVSQPLPVHNEMSADLQRLLSGAGAGAYPAALERLCEALKARTFRTGDLGVTPRNGKREGTLDLLTAGIAELRERLNHDAQAADRLQRVTTELGDLHARRLAEEEKLGRARDLLSVWSEWHACADAYRDAFRRRAELRDAIDMIEATARQVDEGRSALAAMWPERTFIDEMAMSKLLRLEQLTSDRVAVIARLRRIEAAKRVDEEELASTEARLAGELREVWGRPELPAQLHALRAAEAEHADFTGRRAALQKTMNEETAALERDAPWVDARWPASDALSRMQPLREAALQRVHAACERRKQARAALDEFASFEQVDAVHARRRFSQICLSVGGAALLLMSLMLFALWGRWGLFTTAYGIVVVPSALYLWRAWGRVRVIGRASEREYVRRKACVQAAEEVLRELRAQPWSAAASPDPRPLLPSSIGELEQWLANGGGKTWALWEEAAARWDERTVAIRAISDELQALPIDETAVQALRAAVSPFDVRTDVAEVQKLLEACERVLARRADLASCARMREQQLREEGIRLTDVENEMQLLRSGVSGLLAATDGEPVKARKRLEEWSSARARVAAAEKSLDGILAALGTGTTVASLRNRRDLEDDRLMCARRRMEDLARLHPDVPEPDQVLQRSAVDRRAALQTDIATGEKNLAALDQECRSLEREHDRLHDRDVLNLAAAELEMRALEAEEASRRLEVEALGCAWAELRASVAEYQTSHRARLEQAASRYFDAITEESGRTVRFDDVFAVRVRMPDGRDVAPQQLSRGAQDQLYISLRLAIADLLCGERRLPLILDDPFVNCDRERLQRIGRLLEVTARTRQILLLTHREEMASWGTRIDLQAGTIPVLV